MSKGCGFGDNNEIVENLHARYGLSRRQARDKSATHKIIQRQAAEISRLIGVAFPTQLALTSELRRRAWESKSTQLHLLAGTSTIIKKSGANHTGLSDRQRARPSAQSYDSWAVKVTIHSYLKQTDNTTIKTVAASHVRSTVHLRVGCFLNHNIIKIFLQYK